MRVIRHIKTIYSVILYLLSWVIKRNDHYVAFGSWLGKGYLDNSRYLFEYMAEHAKDYTLFWVGENQAWEQMGVMRERCRFLKLNSFRDALTLLKCKYFFFSQDACFDISAMNVFRGATLCYLHHGMPLKKWAEDGLNQSYAERKRAFVKQYGRFRYCLNRLEKRINGATVPYDYFVTSSPLHDATNLTAMKYRGCCAERNIHSGTPRNDMLVRYSPEQAERFKRTYAEKIGFPPDARVVLYLPTYRRVSGHVFSFSLPGEEQRGKLEAVLEKHNLILLEKSHFAEKIEFSGENSRRIKYVGKLGVNVQEMLMFADCLISDYSGAIMDYLLLDRPVIHFAYDYEYYRDVDSGLYYDISDFASGPVVRSFEDLLAAMDAMEQNATEFRERRQEVKKRFMTYEKGTASETIFKTVILSQS